MKILMVCLGNICRSPLAEELLRLEAKISGLNILIDSAGTSGHHNGESPDKRSQKNALKNGVDISHLKSRKFNPNDFEKFDLIYVMDKNNYREVINQTNNEDYKNKVKFFLKDGKDVPDPWYGDEEEFEKVFKLIQKRCKELINEFQSAAT